MSDGFKFELNREGVRQLLNSNEMVNVLNKYADKVGNGKKSTHHGRNRCNVSVKRKGK